MTAAALRLRAAARAVRRGGVIAYPTEAVYGLGCDPADDRAVRRLLALKQRPAAKGLILIAARPEQLQRWLLPLSDHLMSELRARRESETRERMIEAGTAIRAAEGPGALARRLVARLEPDRNYAIDSVRHPAEVEVLRGHAPDFRLIWTEASEATRTYPVNVLIEQPEDVTILPGMAGEASATVELPGNPDDPQALEVRLSALATDDQEKSYVWVIDPETQTVSRRDVELGETTTRGIFVRGLRRGEWVAVAGTKTLQEGQKVRMVEAGRRG